jgi:hypothetical protein
LLARALPPSARAARKTSRRRTRSLLLLIGLGVVALSAAAPPQASVGVSAGHTATRPQLWGVGLGHRTLGRLSDRTARRAQGAHVNALLINGRHLSKRQWRRVWALGRRYRFQVIALPAAATASKRGARKACAKARRRHKSCTILARTLSRSRTLASVARVDAVVVKVKKLPSVTALRRLRSARTRVIVVVEIGSRRTLERRSWSRAIAEAAAGNALDLAVTPVGRYGSLALSSFLSLLPGGASGAPPPPRPPPGKANLFVAANGSDSGGNCKRFGSAQTSPDSSGASLCRSFNRAYQLASPGDTVEVEGGSYPSQTLAAKAGASAPNVLFRPASGAGVSLDSLETEGSYLSFHDLTVATGNGHARGWYNSGSNVLLDGVDITGPWANVHLAGSNLTWENGGLGNPGNTVKRLCAQGDGEPVELANVNGLLMSNLDFYPFQPELGNPACGPDSNMHLETIRVWDAVSNWRLERSRFHRGDGSGSARVFFSKISGPDPSHVTFVNNWFGSSSGTVSIYLTANSACSNYTFAYNAWEQGFIDDCSPKTSLTLVGNTGTEPNYLPCMGTANIRDLWVWNAAGSCGSDQWVLDPGNSLGALKYASDGYHLQAGSPAINAGETTQCMALTGGVDIDGRPRSAPCDAGPDEYGN